MHKPPETLTLALDALGMGFAPVPIVKRESSSATR